MNEALFEDLGRFIEFAKRIPGLFSPYPYTFFYTEIHFHYEKEFYIQQNPFCQ